MTTVTAPGKAVLPDADAIRAWNDTASVRWRRLHGAASQAAARQGSPATVVTRNWEYQKRGALHAHVLLGVGTARELAGAHTYVRHLCRLSGRYGFGFVDRKLKRSSADSGARYVAKYLSPLRGGKVTLSETVLRRDCPPHVLYVNRRLTGRTGVTMRSLRWRRRCFMARVDPDTGETWKSMMGRAAETQDADLIKRLAELLGAPQDL